MLLSIRRWPPLLRSWVNSNAFSSMTKTASAETRTEDTYAILSNPSLSYQDIFFKLRHQASNSMLLHVKTDSTICQHYLGDHLKSFCSHHGNVLYLRAVEESKNHFIVEFSSHDGVASLSSACDEGALKLRMASLSPQSLHLKFHQSKINEKNLNRKKEWESLNNAANLSEQIKVYYELNRASSDHLRKQFFLSSLFQDFFNWHMSADVTAIPFGTTVFGFSSPSSDLDVSLCRLTVARDGGKKFNSAISSLNHLPKKSAQLYQSMHRAGTNKLFKEACNYMNKHLPGVSNVTFYDAQIPIIRFHFVPLHSDVDISLDNKIGVQMGFIVNVYSRMDSRVAPFLFLIRAWAKQQGITGHGGPTYSGITPFMLTCLGLYYLMRVKPAVLPTMMDMLAHRPKPDDLIIGGFRTKIHNQCAESKNTDNLEDLFMGFLEYFLRFHFSDQGACLRTGATYPSRSSLLNILIPFMSESVGKLCSLKSCSEFQRQIEYALRTMEGKRRRRNGKWGITTILNLSDKP